MTALFAARIAAGVATSFTATHARVMAGSAQSKNVLPAKVERKCPTHFIQRTKSQLREVKNEFYTEGPETMYLCPAWLYRKNPNVGEVAA